MKWPHTLALLCAGTVLFTGGLGRTDFVTSHEARVVQTARQMAAVGWPWSIGARVRVPAVELREVDGSTHLLPAPERGYLSVNPWLVPVMNGQLRLSKPPLAYWCTALAFRILGYGEWQARVFPALLGLLCTLLVYDIAGRTLGRRAAIPAAIVWLTTHFVLEEFRKATADPYLAFFTLAAVWSWIAASSRNARPARWVLVTYTALAFGFLAKGPVILATTLPAILLLSLTLGRRPRAPGISQLIGVVLALAIALPWYIAMFRAFPGALELWRFESVGQFADNTEKSRPWWSYVAMSFQLPLPWTPLWMAGIVAWALRGRRGMSSPRGRRRAFAIRWFAVCVLFFSLANVKKAAYLLPILPAQTLIVADVLSTMLALSRRKLHKSTVLLASLQVTIGCGVATVLFATSRGFDGIDNVVPAIALGVTFLALIPLLLRRVRVWMIAQAAAYALVLIVLIGIHAPRKDNLRSPRRFARELVGHLGMSTTRLLVGPMPEEVSAYLPLGLPDALGLRAAVVVVDDRHNRFRSVASEFPPRVYFRQVDSCERIELSGAVDNARWKLFRVDFPATDSLATLRHAP